MAEHSKPSN